MLELKNGQIINEVMYLHFINWKRTMEYCEVDYNDNPNQFYISYKGMHYDTHSYFSKVFNELKNLYNGYYVLLRRIKLKKKIKSLKKRVINRLARI